MWGMTPGKRSTHSSSLTAPSHSTDSAARAPGKSTLTGHLSGPTGNKFVDEGSHTDEHSFLNPEQRSRLVQLFQGRTIVAEGHYQTAASDVRVDKLLAKADTDLPWIASLMIDLALGFVTTKLITSAIAFRNAAKVARATQESDNALRAVLGAAEDPIIQSRISKAATKVTDDHIKTAVGTQISNTKAQTLSRIASARQAAYSEGKQESLDLIEQIRNIASLSFLQFREQSPATASDADLVVMFDAMHPDHHQIGHYAKEIAAMIGRYDKSQVGRIRYFREEGKNDHDPKKRMRPDSSRVFGGGAHTDDQGNGEDEGTYVIWNRYVSGFPKRLVFEHAGKLGNTQGTNGRHGGERGTNHFRASGVQWSRNPDADGYFVPSEFVEVALLRHEQTWGPVATELVDDSDWHWEPARAEAARRNKAGR